MLQVGVDRIMFSADHPYSSMAEARRFLDQLPVSSADRLWIAHENAQRLFARIEVARFAQQKYGRHPPNYSRRFSTEGADRSFLQSFEHLVMRALHDVGTSVCHSEMTGKRPRE